MGLRPQPANEFALIRTSIWMFPKIVGFPPKSSILIGPGFPVFHNKPSILGVVPLFLETPIFLPGVVFNHPVDPHQGDWASEVQLCPSEASQRTKGYRDAGGNFWGKQGREKVYSEKVPISDNDPMQHPQRGIRNNYQLEHRQFSKKKHPWVRTWKSGWVLTQAFTKICIGLCSNSGCSRTSMQILIKFSSIFKTGF